MPQVITKIPLDELFRDYANGDETSWAEEREHLEAIHPNRLARIRREIESGFLPPIAVCFNEKRVIDGHHRVLVAADLGLTEIPAVDAWVDEEWTKHMALSGADA